MREGWTATTLSDLAEIATGSRAKGGAITSGIPSIGGEQIAEDRSIKFNKMKFVSEEHFGSMRTGQLKFGDSLLVKDGATTGKVGYWRYNIPAAVNEHVFILRARKDKAEPYYINLLISHQSFKQEIESRTRGIIGGITRDIENIEFEVPPLPEQKRIVDLISSVDSYIEALQKQLESARKSRNAVLHEFMNGEGTALELTRLGQIAEFLNGKAYSKEELLPVGKYRVLRVGNFFSNNNWYWSDLELEPNKYCENGDLLYAWSASFGPRIWNEEKVIYHYHIWKVNPDESKVHKKWLFYWLEDDVERVKSASGSGSIMIHVTKAEIEKRAIRLPTLSEQNRQILILESFDQNIHTLENLIEATNKMRSSMLSDLLSGAHEIPASYDMVIGSVA
jgi:type I restriction enzyme, S subunit